MDDAKKRSAVMRAVKSKDTKPEIKVRQYKAGYRYRKDFRVGARAQGVG